MGSLHWSPNCSVPQFPQLQSERDASPRQGWPGGRVPLRVPGPWSSAAARNTPGAVRPVPLGPQPGSAGSARPLVGDAGRRGRQAPSPRFQVGLARR